MSSPQRLSSSAFDDAAVACIPPGANILDKATSTVYHPDGSTEIKTKILFRHADGTFDCITTTATEKSPATRSEATPNGTKFCADDTKSPFLGAYAGASDGASAAVNEYGVGTELINKPPRPAGAYFDDNDEEKQKNKKTSQTSTSLVVAGTATAVGPPGSTERDSIPYGAASGVTMVHREEEEENTEIERGIPDTFQGVPMAGGSVHRQEEEEKTEIVSHIPDSFQGVPILEATLVVEEDSDSDDDDDDDDDKKNNGLIEAIVTAIPEPVTAIPEPTPEPSSPEIKISVTTVFEKSTPPPQSPPVLPPPPPKPKACYSCFACCSCFARRSRRCLILILVALIPLLSGVIVLLVLCQECGTLGTLDLDVEAYCPSIIWNEDCMEE